MHTFKYQQIDLKDSSFRIVQLLRGTILDDVIECELIQTTLDENVIPYEAVSYTWGSSFRTHKIKIQGLDFLVTSNLWNLLHDLRQYEADCYLWIDAISINQYDDLERGHQVRQMRDIYSGAERVLCYVGQTSESIDVFMNSLVTFQKYTSGYRWAPDDSRWKLTWDRAQIELRLRYGNDVAAIQEQGLQLLLTRPWFRRVWVLQEVASARKASLCCGRNSIPVQIFFASTSVLDADLDSHSRAVLKLMPTYSRKTLHRNLCQILVDFHRSEASEPRDKIFALLGLCADQSVWEAVVPDYTQTQSALVCTTITYIMTKGVDSPLEWISSACPPSIHLFLNDLANTFNYAASMNSTQGLIDENAHVADTVPLDRPTAFEMMSLVLKYDNNLNNRPTRTPRHWNILNEIKFPLHVLTYNYLLNRLNIMIEMSVQSLRDEAVLNWRKEVYRLVSLISGPCLIDVEQAFRNSKLVPDQSPILQVYQNHLIYLNNLISGSDLTGFTSRVYRDSILRYYRNNFKTPVRRIDFLSSDPAHLDLLSPYGEDLLSRRPDDTRDFISGQDDLIFGSDLIDFISRAYRNNAELRVHLNSFVIRQGFIRTTNFMQSFARALTEAEVLEQEVSTMLTDLGRRNLDGFEDWALFTMGVLYGRMWTEKGLLVKKPAGFDQGGMCDALALYSAIYFQHVTATGGLLDRGVKIVIGQLPNPLSLAVHHKNSAILEVLRAHPTNIVGSDDRLPLHCAVELETVPVIRFLLEQGADLDAVDRDGRTALQVAKDSGRFGVACLLKTVRDGILDDRCAEAAEAVEVIITMNEITNWVEEYEDIWYYKRAAQMVPK
ncbi:heterokaryon incompatibility protein-domain-containing protein [Xylaria cubensis]|nr:heterokaryon incompatibility protein-domain-containing protein [Xylaria cubensis]